MNIIDIATDEIKNNYAKFSVIITAASLITGLVVVVMVTKGVFSRLQKGV